MKVASQMMQDYLTRYSIDRAHVYLCYSLGLDQAIMDHMEQMVQEAGFKNIKWIEAGGVISSHAGPGGFGVAGLEN